MIGSRPTVALRRGSVEAEDELRQRALTLWLPARAARVLCIAYGEYRLPLMLAEAASALFLASPDEGWAAAQRDEAAHRGWGAIHLLPDGMNAALPEGLDAAILLAMPGSSSHSVGLPRPARFIEHVAEAFRALRPGGTLLIGWETATGVLLSGRGRPRAWPAVRWSRSVGAGLRTTLPGFAARRAELIRIYPSLTKPTLLVSRRAPARLKGLALEHAGRLRWPASVRTLAPLGRIFLPDLLPPALLWRLEK